MSVHYLKTWPVYFDATERGEKTFEVRRDDRGFQKGDTLVLQRTREDNITQISGDWCNTEKRVRADRELHLTVLWILTGGQFGIEPGYVVMATKRVRVEGEK